ncbi:unnamed protein product (macronuclear) [Paramecium tetraurelia]|uniref:Uncharacterized protein n=1 Tax=Paramecium tetraurelia TaxID=5888 RepID=A0DU11_PARTE|nr:uncharacterized protein GSPATT00020212001 [Paramecium tetraurelia]CAK86528.1 unnamed protein product [Paramecium tetraurelia]|eukprot:XP_001453925.1 hypothetical protein (macronuclear) [Paramecium tetraurelia strain d4-2]
MYYLATPTTIEKYTQKNIFQDPIIEIMKNKSPMSDRDLVGPKFSLKKLSEMKTQSCEQSQIQNVEPSRFEKFYQSIKPSLGLMKLENKLKQQRVSVEPKKKKPNLIQPELINKQDLLYQLKMMKLKNRIRQEQKSDLIDNMKKEVKMVVTKEERILNQFQQLQQNRIETSLVLGNRTGRSLDKTLYQRSNDFRQKYELNLALNDHLIADKRVWYRQIRKKHNSYYENRDPYSVDEKPNYMDSTQVVADIYTNYSTHYTPKQQFTEIIQVNQKLNQPLYSKKTQDDLKKKLKEINPDSPLLSFDHKLDIQLQGISKFDKEYECVLQDDDNQLYQIAENLDHKKQQSENENVIIANWNLKKKGQTFYPKITKYII